MSNEELVVLIQSGERERMGELWEQIEKLVMWKAHKVITELDGCGGVEFEDLCQSGYLAMVAAVDSYNPESGAFSTWFMYYLKTAFAEATGYRTKTQKYDPLRFADSLDAPLDDSKDSDTKGDLVPDPRGQQRLEAVEDSLYQEELHKALEEALAALPERSAEVLRLRYYQGMTLADIGERQGTTAERARRIETQGLRELRRPRYRKALQPFFDFDFYCGTGFGSFQHSGMSVQERYLVLEEQWKERADQREAKRRKEEIQSELEEATERAKQEAQAKVASMTPEEKAKRLAKYGLT